MLQSPTSLYTQLLFIILAFLLKHSQILFTFISSGDKLFQCLAMLILTSCLSTPLLTL